jgi:CheY-like chemotaxis protein
MILLLEDDAERITRFRATAARLGIELVVWRSAFDMLAELPTHFPTATLIGLDHDLISEPGEPDLGDGLMIARQLVTLPERRPVVIHTSNGVRGDWMEGELQLAGWKYRRILPIGDDWIEVDWRRAVKQLLRRKGSP